MQEALMVMLVVLGIIGLVLLSRSIIYGRLLCQGKISSYSYTKVKTREATNFIYGIMFLIASISLFIVLP